MKKIVNSLIAFLALVALMSSCKKEYNCTCSNPGGIGEVKIIRESSKEKAAQKCEDYYNQQYGNIPWNETHCSID